MKKRSLTLFLVAFFTTLTSSAQLQDYDGLGIFYRNTITSNTKLPGAINEKAFHGVDIDFSRSRFEDGNLQFSLRNRVIGDFISLIFPGNLKRIWGSDVGPGTTGFSSGFLGWYNAGWTVYQTDFINIAPGFSIHDYTYVAVSNSSKSNIPDGYLEPSGYYFAFGPCIFIDAALPDFPVTLHFEGSYMPSTRVHAQKSKLGDNYDKSSKKPHFINLQLEFRYKKVFFALSPVWLINRYEATQNFNSGSRFDTMIGVRI